MNSPERARAVVVARRRPRTSTWYVEVREGREQVYRCHHGHHTERSALRCGRRRLTQIEADVR